MLKINFTSALRFLRKSRSLTMINLLGLSLAVATFLLISLYVKNELTFDQFHKRNEDIYRVIHGFKANGATNLGPTTNDYAKVHFEEHVPEIERIARIRNANPNLHWKDDVTSLQKAVFADKSLFEIFDFELVAGDIDLLDDQLNGIVVTASFLQNQLGAMREQGDFIELSQNGELKEYQIVAVIADHPANSSLEFDLLFSWKLRETIHGKASPRSFGFSLSTFIQLYPDADPELVEAKLNEAIKEWPVEQSLDWLEFRMQPLSELHINDYLQYSGGGIAQMGNSRDINILMGVAILILSLASINYSNLSAGRMLARLREVGIRKVFGASKKQLMGQFFVESLVLTVGALVFGLILSELFMSDFELLIAKELGDSVWNDQFLLPYGIVLALVISGLSFFYPVLLAMKSNILQSLKGNVKMNGKNWFSKVMITFQFAIAILIVSAMGVIYHQTDYLVTRDLGYNEEGLIRISGHGARAYEDFRPFLSSFPGVTGVEGVKAGMNSSRLDLNGENVFVDFISCTEGYLNLLGVPLLEGEGLRESSSRTYLEKDTLTNILVNEELVKVFGLEDPVGKRFGNRNDYLIKGVIKDFNYSSNKYQIKPLIITSSPKSYLHDVMIRYEGNDIDGFVAKAEEAWASLPTMLPLRWRFISDELQAFYAAERRWKKIISTASLMAGVICAIGLLGLVNIVIQNKLKEIGIRRVLGSSASRIIRLIGKQFSILLFLSILIATPLSYYFLSGWLSVFPYHIELNALHFAVPAVAILTLCGMIISTRSIKAARINPVETLSEE